jgi:hypothetical protein
MPSMDKSNYSESIFSPKEFDIAGIPAAGIYF